MRWIIYSLKRKEIFVKERDVANHELKFRNLKRYSVQTKISNRTFHLNSVYIVTYLYEHMFSSYTSFTLCMSEMQLN
jgi:hypothetical protein